MDFFSHNNLFHDVNQKEVVAVATCLFRLFSFLNYPLPIELLYVHQQLLILHPYRIL
jgi:hypothetical protein